ncbi:glycosyltransferase family 4 protein [Actinoplanes sp. TFC3]|uniref:glycosyltransferase family 4 protein n=1 Tax=Actinoplanes sp. TFC3 TaxID=1710355 RepID=UPI0009EA1CAD|nr:glycosyltransferase family 4 protein [Actinoplanes sp. TFC3]
MSARLQVITPVFPPAVGGIESLTYGLAERWDGPVEILTLDEPGAAEWDANSRYGVHRVTNVPRGGRKSIARLTYATVAHTRRFKPDLILSMHVRCGYAAALAKLISGATWLQYYHAKEVPTWPSATRLCARRADHGVAVSRYTRTLVQAVSPLAGPLSVIPPGIPAPRTTLRTRRAHPTMLTVARINDPYKGHDVLLEAMPFIRHKVPDVRWVVVGAGDRLPWLRDEVRARGLTDHVEILGLVDDDKRDELFASSDVFVLPSRTSEDGRSGEGFGIVYAEAAAVGLPIVAGAQGGVLDAVHNEVSGLLVDPTDPRQVADAVTTLLCDDERRTRMSLAAREWSRRFEWGHVAAAFQDLATKTLHQAKR